MYYNISLKLKFHYTSTIFFALSLSLILIRLIKVIRLLRFLVQMINSQYMIFGELIGRISPTFLHDIKHFLESNYIEKVLCISLFLTLSTYPLWHSVKGLSSLFLIKMWDIWKKNVGRLWTLITTTLCFFLPF